MDKKTLQDYRAIDAELQQLAEQIELMEARIYEAQTTRLTLTPKGGGFSGDAILSDLAALESLRDLYNQKWDAFIDARTEIELAIDCLEPREKRVIELGYINGMKWSEVAAEMNCTYRNIFYLRDRAIEKINKADSLLVDFMAL